MSNDKMTHSHSCIEALRYATAATKHLCVIEAVMMRSMSYRLAISAALPLAAALTFASCSDQSGPPEPVASVTVDQGSATVVLQGSVQLTATTKDGSGTVLTGRVVLWATSDPAVATVSTTGLVTGLAEGAATITATSETKSGTANIAVVSLVFAEISAGDFHTCGVTTAGVAACWGANLFGTLGDGSESDRLFPVLVAGVVSFSAVSAAGGETFENGLHTCGLTAAGAAYCWGFNSFGQLGAGTTTGPEACLAGVPCHDRRGYDDGGSASSGGPHSL